MLFLSRTFTEDLATIDLNKFIDLDADSFKNSEYEELIRQVQ